MHVFQGAEGEDASKIGLIMKKDRGGLTYPCKDVVNVCKIAEKILCGEKEKTNFFSNKMLLQKLGVKIVGCCITQHPSLLQKADHEPLHRYNLLKKIALIYCSIGCKHFARGKNCDLKGKKLRKKLSKIVLFKHQ